MFTPETYIARRNALRKEVKSGIILLPGNTEAAYNYPANPYYFRQDSNFSYFFGLNHPDLVGVIDLDNGVDYIFGNDMDIDDIIWMGQQPTIQHLAEKAGIENTGPILSCLWSYSRRPCVSAWVWALSNNTDRPRVE